MQVVPPAAITLSNGPELTHSAFRPTAADEHAKRQMVRSGKDAAEVIAMKRTTGDDGARRNVCGESAESKGASPRRLPVVRIRGRFYYQDDRLGEFRAIDAPWDRIPFDVMRLAVAILGKWPD